MYDGGKMKTLLLIRHSDPIKNSGLDTEDIPLSIYGINKMKEFSKQEIFQNLDFVYTSNYKRAIETANILTKSYLIDSRFSERLIGDQEYMEKNFWIRQYLDLHYKIQNGESLLQVKERMSEGIHNILAGMLDGQKAAIVSHATAICSYLFTYCSIHVMDENEKIRKICFKNEEIFYGKISTPCVFVLEYYENTLYNIRHVNFTDGRESDIMRY